MDTNVAAVTVSFAVPAFSVTGSAAVIVVMPTADEAANPFEPAALLTVATETSADVHVTDDVKSCVVRSEYVPVAVNGCFVPRAILRLTGVTSMDTNVAAVTVSFAVSAFPVAGSEAVISVMPTADEAANPFETATLPMVATISSEDFHVTDDVRSCVVRSEYVPVALNCWSVPRAILRCTGVTAMDTNVAAVTVSFAAPAFLVAGSTAVIVTGPPVSDENANPLKPSALLTVATDKSDEVHVTDDVRIFVVASEYRPVATNCWFIPRTILRLTGVTAMETNVAEVTVSFAVSAFPETGSVAVIVTGPPTFKAVANPLKPAALLMVATDKSDDVHVTDDVRSCVVKSEYVPVAINCWFTPRITLASSGVTAKDTNVAAVTVSVAVPVFPVTGSAAVIVVMPTADESANPLEPVMLLTSATDASEDVHVTDDVRSWVVKSEYVPVAVNCWPVPRAILRFTGVTSIDTSVAAVTVSFAVPVFPVTGSAAVTVTGPPMDFEVANPLNFFALLTVATVSSEDVHVT
jgi:hypothetical protein